MKVSIPQPCSENWSEMSPTEKGAFCQKCAFEVTDFTNKSAVEIKAILSEKMQAKERVCGHIENRQLIEINNEFIPWQSDQQSFRAVWVFSLVAVFGLTLFSCQSTFSKEVVEQMQTRSEQMMEEEEKDTLDIAQLNDSIAVMNDTIMRYRGPDSLVISPWQPWAEIDPWLIITGTSIMSPLDGFVKCEPEALEIVCVTEWMGNLVINGSITPIDDDEDSFDPKRFLAGASSSPIAPTPGPLFQERQIHPTTTPLDAKRESGKPDFAAYISPNPVDESSKLYVTIPEEGEVRLTLWEIPSLGKVHAENFDLVFGNHVVDINFTDLPAGKYACQLVWNEEKVIVPFEVLANIC